MTFTRVLAILMCCCSLSYATTYTDIHDFAGPTADGSHPNSSPIQASNGLLYGTAAYGGLNGSTPGDGVIFSYDPVHGTYAVLYNFGAVAHDGIYPTVSLIQASNGLMYGMTTNGGASGAGTIFSYDPVHGTYSKIHDFGSGSDGQSPNGSLIQASNGSLYGMTPVGGSGGNGVIFSFSLSTSTYEVIYNFAGGTGDGGAPFGSLLQASNGVLYGVTSVGGSHGQGIIFSLSLAGAYAVEYNFGAISQDGSDPLGSLIQATNGLVYGMTDEGGAHNKGMIFSFSPENVAGTYTKLYDFGSITNDGSGPNGSLLQASNGLLYGTTLFGGANGGSMGFGTLFSFDPTSPITNYTVIHNFGSGMDDGTLPGDSLIQASNGLLYGTTSQGGSGGNGMMFSLVVPVPQPPSSSLQRAFQRSPGPGGYRSR